MLKNVELHDKTKILKKELAQAKKKRDQVIKQLRNIFNFFTFNFIVEKRNTKHSDLSFFTDKKNSTFDDWSLRIQDKLLINENHFLSSVAQAIYVIFRIEEDASSHNSAYQINKFDYFQTLQVVIIVLNNVYVNLNRERNVRWVYIKLR